MELKFRAWWSEAEEYVKVSGIDFTNEEIHYIEEYRNKTYSIDEIPFEEVIIEQYTGLKDKDGTEIYIGDIIEVEMYDDTRKLFIVDNRPSADVGCNGGEYGFTISGIVTTQLDGSVDRDGECELAYDSLVDGMVDIVGNIHENKELLV